MLEIGSLVYQRTLKFYPDHPDLTRTQLDFKAKPGKAFALMVLGMVPRERAEEFSPNKQLQQMGWSFFGDDHPWLIELLKDLVEHRDVADCDQEKLARCLKAIGGTYP